LYVSVSFPNLLNGSYEVTKLARPCHLGPYFQNYKSRFLNLLIWSHEIQITIICDNPPTWLSIVYLTCRAHMSSISLITTHPPMSLPLCLVPPQPEHYHQQHPTNNSRSASEQKNQHRRHDQVVATSLCMLPPLLHTLPKLGHSQRRWRLDMGEQGSLSSALAVARSILQGFVV
jgi:hypothetical protein